MTKISHFTAIGLLVVAGYALSLGAEGRTQVAAMSEVVSDQVTSVFGQMKVFAGNMAFLESNLSFANIYSALGVFTGAAPVNLPTTETSVSTGLVVVQQKATEATAAQEVQDIKASFSDTVKVRPDATKKSGTITPVFKGVEGQNYTYVIVPIKKQ